MVLAVPMARAMFDRCGAAFGQDHAVGGAPLFAEAPLIAPRTRKQPCALPGLERNLTVIRSSASTPSRAVALSSSARVLGPPTLETYRSTASRKDKLPTIELFRRQCGLSDVVREVTGAAEQNRQAIAKRIRSKILVGDGRMFPDPIRYREVAKCGQQAAVHVAPVALELRRWWQSVGRLIRRGQEGRGQFRM